jgi:transposase
MTRIVEHLSVEELERRCRAAQDATEARHTQAIWLLAQGRRLLAQGRSVLDVAGVLAFAPRWVEQLLAARYNAHGPEALGDQRRRNKGRAASVLTPALLAALSERLRTPPEDGGRWTGAKVALWMARQLGVERVHPQRGWEALKRVRWSLQAPRPRHPRSATPEQQAEFTRGSTTRSRVPGPRTRTGRSRSGPRTSTASA